MFLEKLLPKTINHESVILKESTLKPQKRASGVSIAFNQSLLALKQNCTIKENTPSGFTIKIANTLEERESAYRLAYKVYLEKIEAYRRKCQEESG